MANLRWQKVSNLRSALRGGAPPGPGPRDPPAGGGPAGVLGTYILQLQFVYAYNFFT